MKNLVIILSVAVLSISMNVNAQEVAPSAKKEVKATPKKGCCAKDMKTCDKDKKGCCAKKA